MKKTLVVPLFISALVIAPLAAHAEDAESTGGKPSTSASAEVRVEANAPRPILDRLLGQRKENTEKRAENMEKRAENANRPEPKERMASTTRDERKGEVTAKVQDRSAEKIAERIKRLEDQIARIAKMERLSDSQKASITAELEAQITGLTELKGKIGSETDADTLKGLAQSVTKSFRVYAVTMPKAAITAAADRIMTVAAQMESFSEKLSARVDAAATAGVDVSAARAALSDFMAKIADAKVQAQAAASAVAGLSADNGDTATQTSNTAALKEAKVKIDAGQADLKAARKDIDTILKAVKGTGGVTATTETSATNQ